MGFALSGKSCGRFFPLFSGGVHPSIFWIWISVWNYDRESGGMFFDWAFQLSGRREIFAESFFAIASNDRLLRRLYNFFNLHFGNVSTHERGRVSQSLCQCFNERCDWIFRLLYRDFVGALDLMSRRIAPAKKPTEIL